MAKKTLLYCDPCASNNGLPIQDEKNVKSTCHLCQRFIGPLNEVVEEDVVPNGISTEVINIGSFQIEQLPNFLKGMNPKDIHPSLPYSIKSQDLVLYFPSIEDDEKGRKTLIITNPKDGEEFKIILPDTRKTKSAGMVDADPE